MKLYNTLTRKKEVLQPLDPPKVGLYCCGPTVYNYAHIGNLRTYVFEDLLRRALEFNGYVVEHVMNITDVGHLTSDADEGEDKMRKGAEREKMTVWDIAEKYTQAFLEDMDRLNLLQPHVKCKATDHIQEMIDQVKKLEANGLTYIGQNGNVYYDTSKFKHYGELAQLDKQELQAGARIEVDPNKKNPHDFVLWFVESKHGDQEMQWDSPWGRGFPGWHIECSAMSSRYLGDQFDIHCGGIDHIPVHHTNEIAQAEGASGKHPWVQVWMHGNFLVIKKPKLKNDSPIDVLNLSKALTKKLIQSSIETIGQLVQYSPVELSKIITTKDFEEILQVFNTKGLQTLNIEKIKEDKEKMAKSGENFLTLRTLIEKNYNPLDYRYFCLQAHYRKELNFSWEALDGAKNALRKLYRRVADYVALEYEGQDLKEYIESGQSDPLFVSYYNQFQEAINDDLNMPDALAVLWDHQNYKGVLNGLNTNAMRTALVHKFDEVLGLKLIENAKRIKFGKNDELPNDIQALILERNQARDAKDWAKADELRDKIQESGKWTVKDGPGGTEVMPK